MRYYVQYFGQAFPAQRNAQMRGAVHDGMRFWLERGVDGIRVDVVGHLLKDEQFRDNPVNPDFRERDPQAAAATPQRRPAAGAGIIAGEAVDRSIDLRGNESLVTALSAEADVPASVLQVRNIAGRADVQNA